MTKRILNAVLLISLVFFLSVFSANAEIVVKKYQYTEDYSFSSNNKIINTCACATFLDVITVKNAGNKPSIYSATADNANVNIYPKNFVLSPGETKNLMNYIKTPCNSKSYDFSVLIETTSGIKKEIKQHVTVSKCQNLVALPIQSNATINLCQEAKFSFLLNNTNGFTETYDLSVDKLSDFASFSENPVVINSSNSKLIELKISPDCSIYGIYDITLNILARNNKLNAKVPLKLDIPAKYDTSLTITDSSDVCLHEESIIPFKLKNNADIKNNYSVQLIGPDFIKLDAYAVELNPKEEKTLNVLINPKQIGDYSFVIKAESEFGNIILEKNISLKVEDCYTFDLFIAKDKFCSNDDNYVILKNTGSKKELIKLEVISSNSPNISKLTEDYVSLSPGETKEILVKLNLPQKDANYKFEVLASLVNKTFSKRASVNLMVTNSEKCYNADISPKLNKVDYSEALITYVLTNKGSRTAIYTVTEEKPDFLDIDTITILLNPGEKKEFTAISSPSWNKTKSMIYKIKFNIHVSEADISFERDSYIRLVRCDYAAKLNNYKFYLAITLVLILIMLLFFFKMIRPKGRLNRRKERSLLVKRIMAATIVIVIFFLLFYCVACTGITKKACSAIKDRFEKNITFEILNETLVEEGDANENASETILLPIEAFENNTFPINAVPAIKEPEKPLCENYTGKNICNSSLYIHWNKNTAKTIDLKNYFYDPENGTLTFDYDFVDNISIKIENGFVILNPDKNWYGVREEVFTASDPEGAETLSGVFVFNVENKEETIFGQAKIFLRSYRFYFAFGLILLFILIALFFFMKSERE